MRVMFQFTMNNWASLFDVVKKHTPDYRTYLRLWNQETKSKLENMKNLPKLNQVHVKSRYNND